MTLDPTETLLHKALAAIQEGRPIPHSSRKAVLGALRERVSAEEKREVWIYRQYGQGWLVGPSGSETHIQSRRNGHRFIQFLIRNPGKQIPALSVYHLGRLAPVEVGELFTENGKARVNLRNQITRAMEELAIYAPEVLEHLENHLQTGLYLSYSPDPITAPLWKTSE
jgi:hypothetical protein